MKTKKIVSLFTAVLIACASVISLSAFDIPLEKGESYAMSEEELSAMLGQEEKIRGMLCKEFADNYANQTVYVGNPYKIYDRAIYLGGRGVDWYCPIFADNGKTIGVLEFTKQSSWNTPTEYYGDTNCRSFDSPYKGYFHTEEAIAYIKDNPYKSYIFVCGDEFGGYEGLLSENDEHITLYKSEYLDESRPSFQEFQLELFFKSIKDKNPKYVVGLHSFTLDKDTAKPYLITDDFITQKDIETHFGEDGVKSVLSDAFGKEASGKTYYVGNFRPFKEGYLSFKNNKPIYKERGDILRFPVWEDNGKLVGILVMGKYDSAYDSTTYLHCYTAEDEYSPYSYMMEFLEKAEPSKEYALVGLGDVTLGLTPVSRGYIAVDKDGNKLILSRGQKSAESPLEYSDTVLDIWNTDRSVVEKTLNDLSFNEYSFGENVISTDWFKLYKSRGGAYEITMPIDVTLAAGVEE